MEIAMQQALVGTMNSRHGAVLARGSRIIATGHNTDRTRALGKNCVCEHAEMCAMRHVKMCRHADMYVIRLAADGTAMRMSKPCKSCAFAMYLHGVNRVFYSTPDGGWVAERIRDVILTKPYVTKSQHKFEMSRRNRGGDYIKNPNATNTRKLFLLFPRPPPLLPLPLLLPA